MIVVGGTYSEYCYHPEWDQIYGSGGRGAAALKRLGVKNVILKTCIAPEEMRAVKATLSPYNVNIDATESRSLYEFIYTHPLSEPYLKPYPPHAEVFKKRVRSDVAFVYGMLEGLPHISAKCIVFDPQSETNPAKPFEFIDATEKLAVVLNETEVASFSGSADIVEGAKKLILKNGVEVVVVKQGPFGCIVIDAKNETVVPVFPSDCVFKIGSGDVFSAAFAKFWAIDGLSAVKSAQNASRCTSIYCNSRSLDGIGQFDESVLKPLKKTRTPSIYLAEPFFSLAQRFLVEEARRSLLSLGVNVFSPLHDVGTDEPPDVIAREDLQGLDRSTVVLALIPDLDPGTIFEIGFARARQIPVVAYGEGIKHEHLTMLIGSDCVCSEDFCSALYNAVWAGMQ